MNKVLICLNPNTHGSVCRAKALRQTLCGQGLVFDIELLPVDALNILSIGARLADAIVAVGYHPDEFASFSQLATPCLLDWGMATMAEVGEWLDCAETRQSLKKALYAAHGHVDILQEIALRLEDELAIGISTHSIQRALAGCAKRTIVIVGEGLGNMIYATGLIRWLAEKQGAPVDMLIHNRFDTAISLFARAPWVNVIYPGFEYLAGRRYKLLINTVTAGKARPPFSAERMLWLDERYHFNLEGRFVPEHALNFFGLDKALGCTPIWDVTLPLPFIRDVSEAYVHPGSKVIGVATGQKSGSWVKREWGGISALTSRLVSEGWEVHSFGLPGECVPGSKDYTGLPMREVVSEIAKCAYFVSHDGGLFHIADSIGVPSLGLFGPSSMVKNGPIYTHSRAISAHRSCSPCIYKIDWLRCEEAFCMQDLSVDHVYETLNSMRYEIEMNGYKRMPFQVDEATLVHELGALSRPGPEAAMNQYVDDRMSHLRQTPEFFVQYVLSILKNGDIVGAAAIGEYMASKWPDDLVVRFLCGLVRQAHPAPTPMTDARKKVTSLAPEEMGALLLKLETLKLNVGAQSFLLRAGLRYWLQNESKAGLDAFLTATVESKDFSKQLTKPLFRYLDRFVPKLVQKIGIPKDATSRELEQMQLVLRTPFKHRIDDHAKAGGALLGIEPKELRNTGMAPYFVNAPRVDPQILELLLGEITLKLISGSTVVMLVQHVAVKDAVAGSTSGLIIQHARRLSALGMRPIVVTTGYGDVREGWLLRDSVTYLQAHPGWGTAQWQAVFSYFEPALSLSYADAAQELQLPKGVSSKIIEVECDGLFDPQGVYYQFDIKNRWACRIKSNVSRQGGHRITADQLSEGLFYRTERQCESPSTKLRAMVLVHDPRDFVALSQLMQAMPTITFTVMSDFVYRGTEKNIQMLSLAYLNTVLINNVDCLVQFSQNYSVLSAESIVFIEHGKPVIAPSNLTMCSPLAACCYCISEPQKLTSWLSTLKSIVFHRYE